MNKDLKLGANVWEKPMYIVTLSIVLVGVLFLFKGNLGLDLGDEGHLWYGMIQTAQGAVPIRDFRSYDPGRYYWAATWSLIFGSGIIALRISNALFQIIGLSLGLSAVSRVVTNRWLLALVGGLLTIWMFPQHKLYEHSIAMGAIFFAVFLIERPSIKRHFVAGVFIGVAAFIGRNLGVYCFIAFFCLILFIWVKTEKQFLARRLAAWALGIAVGYLPMVFMMIFVPGFFASFIDSVRLLFSPYGPVLPIPIPWPWTIQFSSLTSLSGISKFMVSLIFLIMPIFYLGATIYIISSLKPETLAPGTTLLTSSVFVGIPLMHHAAVRSDVAHLAQSIHPFLIGLIALPFAIRLSRNKWVVSVLSVFILIITFTIAIPREGFPVLGRMMAAISGRPSLVKYELDGDSVWVSKKQADYIESIRQFVNEYVRRDESILIAPYEPGLYPILGKTSPIWDPYPLFPAEEERQRRIIRSLVNRNVNWALISNRPLDGIDERRFSNTHNLVWQYLMKEFTPVDIPGLPDDHLLLHRREH